MHERAEESISRQQREYNQPYEKIFSALIDLAGYQHQPRLTAQRTIPVRWWKYLSTLAAAAS